MIKSKIKNPNSENLRVKPYPRLMRSKQSSAIFLVDCPARTDNYFEGRILAGTDSNGHTISYGQTVFYGLKELEDFSGEVTLYND